MKGEQHELNRAGIEEPGLHVMRAYLQRNNQSWAAAQEFFPAAPIQLRRNGQYWKAEAFRNPETGELYEDRCNIDIQLVAPNLNVDVRCSMGCNQPEYRRTLQGGEPRCHLKYF